MSVSKSSNIWLIESVPLSVIERIVSLLQKKRKLHQNMLFLMYVRNYISELQRHQ